MLKIGSVIDGKYKILNVIGRGGMSVVYLAMNERANRFWAVKEILRSDCPEYAADRKEIEMMKRLRHPGIPSVADVIDGPDSLLIVMDYVEGLSLEALLLEKGSLPQEQVIGWAVQLCRALSYLHSRKPPVIYRDLKPANVMERPDGTVALIDFGAAREYRPDRVKDTVSLGTRGYAAPEQYEETGQSDARTDIYCLGVMMFQLLTGESPHRLRALRDCRPDLSAGLEAIITRCTRVRKEDRYQSCAELLYALEHYQEQDQAYRKGERKKVLRFGALLLGAAFLGGAAGLFFGLETHVRQSSYESYLLAAGSSVRKEEELENYGRAIELNPGREEAWIGLLKEGFLDDNLLTAEESGQLRSFLIRYARNGRTCEAVFRENEEGYAAFAYEMGLAYFYKYEEEENKKYAKSYFEAAAASDTLEEARRDRARRLGLIAGYYADIGAVDAAGDLYVSFRDYWEDLTGLLTDNLVEEDNERTALVMYEELIGQIASRAYAFRKAGVTQEEMLAQLERVRERLDLDFQEQTGEMGELLREEAEELKEEAVRAGQLVRSAFSEEEA